MKDLIFVTAYCPTEEQEMALERCINSLIKCDKHIALISHSHIPIHIQKKCQYYVYDYNNEISDDYNLLGFNNYAFDNRKIISRFFHKYFYGFAIYRMFSIASQIAINFGYQNIHHIEYDCELIDKDLIDENSKLLEEYDSVIYTNNGKEDEFLFGSFTSFKVESLPDKLKNYDKDFIEHEIKKSQSHCLESVTQKLTVECGKAFFKPIPNDEKFKKGYNFHNRNLHFTLFYDSRDKNLNFFYKSSKNLPEEIVVIVNKTYVNNLTVKPYHWHIIPLGIFDDISHIRIDNSEKIIYEKTFEDNFKEMFKQESYITNL
jgi:hypothetical protein